MGEIDAQAVRAHLDRITASRQFAESDRLCRFLRFTVESKLRAQDGRVKEYEVGREVFDRRDDYDPRLDPIVRVEARRLRAKLEEYYEGPGRDEQLRLDYQKGSYLPTFRKATQKSLLSDLTARKSWLVFGAIAVLAVIAASIYFATRPPRGGMVAAVPVQWIDSSPGAASRAELGLAEAINSVLANRQAARVLAWPLILQHANDHKPMQALAAGMGVSKLVLVAAHDVPGEKRITVFLVDAATGQKLHAQSYTWRNLSSMASQQSLAQQIASDLSKRLQT